MLIPWLWSASTLQGRSQVTPKPEIWTSLLPSRKKRGSQSRWRPGFQVASRKQNHFCNNHRDPLFILPIRLIQISRHDGNLFIMENHKSPRSFGRLKENLVLLGTLHQSSYGGFEGERLGMALLNRVA